MKTIKFRAKTIKNNKWLYGSLLFINGKYYIYPKIYGDLNDIDFGSSFKEVNPETICQYLNFKDRDGKEIYENDILYAKTLQLGENVLIVPKIVKMKIKFERIYPFQNLETIDVIDPRTIKIVGNIFDKPEIIKNPQKFIIKEIKKHD